MQDGGDEKSSSDYTDSRHYHANLPVIQSIKERDWAEHKKYIFMVAGKFSMTHSNG